MPFQGINPRIYDMLNTDRSNVINTENQLCSSQTYKSLSYPSDVLLPLNADEGDVPAMTN